PRNTSINPSLHSSSSVSDLGSVEVPKTKVGQIAPSNYALDERMRGLEEENERLTKNLEETKRSLQQTSEISFLDDTKRISPTSEGGNGTRKLQDEINVLTKRNC
ncbi:unnamed protein product, partial [Timema podura]|nr:unnamed protein product [Timema podura]